MADETPGQAGALPTHTNGGRERVVRAVPKEKGASIPHLTERPGWEIPQGKKRKAGAVARPREGFVSAPLANGEKAGARAQAPPRVGRH